MRLAVMLGDFAFETEDRAQALLRYETLLAGDFGQLSKDQRGYLLLAKGACLTWVGRSCEDVRFLTANLKYIKGTPSEARALMKLARRSASSGMEKQGIQFFMQVADRHRKSDYAAEALFVAGWLHLRSGDGKAAKTCFTRCVTDWKKSEYAQAASRMLVQIEKVKSDVERPK